MTEQKLLEKLTGINNPRFITPREDAIIKECLTIINNFEEQLILSGVVDCKHDNEIMKQGDGFVYSTCGDCGDEL